MLFPNRVLSAAESAHFYSSLVQKQLYVNNVESALILLNDIN